MKRIGILLFAVFTFWTIPNFADESKRQRAVKSVIERELGSNISYDIKSSFFKDTIRYQPFDSINIPQALRAYNALQNDFCENCVEFVALFPSGTKDFNPSLLKDKNLTKYELFAEKMRNSLNEYRTLIDYVQRYEPYKQRRLDETYSKKNEIDEIIEEYHATYYFDDEDNLVRYIWSTLDEQKAVFSLINFAKQNDFEFIEKVLEGSGIYFSKELIKFIISDENNRYPYELVKKLQSQRKKQLQVQQTRNLNNNAQTNVSSQNYTPPANRSTTSHYKYNEHNIYIVKKDICGATHTKESMDKYTKYAVYGKTEEINYMLLRGELIVLRKGEKVIMVESGFILSRVMLQDGKTVYTDTENLTKL